MGSLILELQQLLFDPTSDIQDLLRRAYAIAYKLGIVESHKWIQLELDGYTGVPTSEIPEYRVLQGKLQGENPIRGWIPFQLNNDEVENKLCTRILTSSISELISLFSQKEEGNIGFYLSDEMSNKLCSMADTPITFRCAVHLSKHQVKAVIDRVRSRLLEWTLELEKQGILGEGLLFSKEETAAAKQLSQPINYYYGNVIQGDISSSQIVSGNKNTVEFSYGAVSNSLTEINDQLENEQIAQEDKDQIKELIDEIQTKIKEKKKPGVVRAALIGLKDFSISVGANVVAALITKQLTGPGL